MLEGAIRRFRLQNRPEVQATPLRSPNSPACFAAASARTRLSLVQAHPPKPLAPVAGEGAFASFRPVGPARFFPPESLALVSSARPRHSSHSYIRSNPLSIVLLPSSGSPLDALVDFLSPLIELASQARTPPVCWPFPLELTAQCSAPSVWTLPVVLLSLSESPFLAQLRLPEPAACRAGRTPSFARLRPLGLWCRPRQCIPIEYRMRCSARTRAGCPAESHRAWAGAVSACDARQWRQRRVRGGRGRRPAAYGAR